MTNAGGTVSDIWNARERGLAAAIYATVPFLGPGEAFSYYSCYPQLIFYLFGPVIGPIVGGFVAQNPRLGWRFNFWLMFMFSALSFIVGALTTPETVRVCSLPSLKTFLDAVCNIQYAPVLLRWRARSLHKDSGNVVHYVSKYDINRSTSFAQIMRTNLSRPFGGLPLLMLPCIKLIACHHSVFIVSEPIVLLLAVYISIVYGTLYALFSAFPIVFQQHRGFSSGDGGLAFLGVGAGIIVGTATTPIQNRIYWRAMDKSDTGKAPPEA